MIDTRGISDYERRPVVGFSFAEGFERLCLIGSHGHLSHVNITISGGNHTQILFAYALAGCRKFGNGTQWRCFGRLASGIGIDFGIQHQDVDVLARGNHVIQTTVTNVVCSSVTTNNPLAAFNQVFAQAADLLAVVAIAVFHCSNDLIGQNTTLVAVFAVGQPFCKQGFEFFGTAGASLRVAHKFHQTFTHLFVSHLHAVTVFAKILKQ